ncbi:MAG: ribosome maturation factor RimP [Oligoflexales bacterium]
MNREILDRVMELAEASWHEENLSCREAEWDGAFSTLRLYLESGGIPECVRGSKLLMASPSGDAIDGLMPTGYTLEVSSPGVEAPLRRIHHFTGAIGEKVVIIVKDGGKLVEREGVVLSTSVGDSTVTLSIDGSVVFPLNAISKAHVVVDWNAIQRADAGEIEE